MNFRRLITLTLLILIGLPACLIGEPRRPTVSILTPANDERLAVGTEVLVQSVSVSQNQISRVELWVNDEWVDTQTANLPTSFTAIQAWTPETEGGYLLEVRAFDAENLQSLSAAVQVMAVPGEGLIIKDDISTPPVGDQPTVTTKTNLNIRAGPSTDFDRLAVMRQGETALIIGKNTAGTWWLIERSQLPGGSGWVSAHPQFSTALNTADVPIVAMPALPATATPVVVSTPTPTLQPQQLLPIIHYFWADKVNISPGENVLLQWDLDGAEAAYLYPGGENGVVAPGSRQVAPKETTTYRLVARNRHGEVEVTLTVSVNAGN